MPSRHIGFECGIHSQKADEIFQDRVQAFLIEINSYVFTRK